MAIDSLLTLMAVMRPVCGASWLIGSKLTGMEKQIEGLQRENVALAGWRDGVERRLEGMESHLRGGEK